MNSFDSNIWSRRSTFVENIDRFNIQRIGRSSRRATFLNWGLKRIKSSGWLHLSLMTVTIEMRISVDLWAPQDCFSIEESLKLPKKNYTLIWVDWKSSRWLKSQRISVDQVQPKVLIGWSKWSNGWRRNKEARSCRRSVDQYWWSVEQWIRVRDNVSVWSSFEVLFFRWWLGRLFFRLIVRCSKSRLKWPIVLTMIYLVNLLLGLDKYLFLERSFDQYKSSMFKVDVDHLESIGGKERFAIENKFRIENSGICLNKVRNSGSKVRLLIFVKSSVGNIRSRQSIRQTWGARKSLEENSVGLAFLLGSFVWLARRVALNRCEFLVRRSQRKTRPSRCWVEPLPRHRSNWQTRRLLSQ